MYEKTKDYRQALARRSQRTTGKAKLVKAHTIKLSSEDGQTLTDIYKQQIGDYPKFYKMDLLTRLAFVATEKTLSNSPLKGEDKKPVLIFFNHSSSVASDRQFFETIRDTENYFPSPSVFVYTLPNITTGEVAIRHHLCGETSFYILPDKDEALMQQMLEASLAGTDTQAAISGWVDAESETCYECELTLYNIINI